MTDPFDTKNMPGAGAFWDSYTAATKSLQSFAAEMQKVSKDSLAANQQLMDKLRHAKTIEEAVAIQTSFMQQSFTSYADYTRRFSELMMALPMELAKQGRTAFQQGTEAMTNAAHEAGEQMHRAGEEFNKSHG